MATELWTIGKDLSLANVDREDFAGILDEDGAFRVPDGPPAGACPIGKA